MKRIVILGGGTFAHVRNHLSLCAPAFGETARQLTAMFAQELQRTGQQDQYRVDYIPTRMADPASRLETNQDVAALVDQLIADPTVRCVIFNVALADFEGSVGDVPSGKHATRLKTAEGSLAVRLPPASRASFAAAVSCSKPATPARPASK